MSAGLVNCANEESDAKRSLMSLRSLVLCLLLDGSDETLAGVLRTEGVGVVEASVAHELGQEASICSHSRDSDSHVRVDFKDFLLMHCQVMRTLFQPN